MRPLILNLGHWAHQSTKTYYNGLAHDDISNPKAAPCNGLEGEFDEKGFGKNPG